MVDETPAQLSMTWKTVMAAMALIFNGALVIYLIVYGDANNSLHTSALAWAFITSVGILAGLGLGTIFPQLAEMMKR